MQRFARRLYFTTLAALFGTLFVTANAFALTLTFSDLLVSSYSIDDNDGNDLDPAVGVIQFNLDGSQVPGLEGSGSARQIDGPIGHTLQLRGANPGPAATLRNTNVTDMNVTVTVSSSPYASVGVPLGWRMYYEGSVGDPAPDVVAVTAHSVKLSINGTTDLTTAVVDDISDNGDPPIAFSASGSPGSDPLLEATSSEALLAATLGPGDEITLMPDPDDEGLALWAHVFNNDGRCVFRTNTDASKVIGRELKADAYCLKTQLANSGGDATTCVDAIGSTTLADKLVALFPLNCDPLPPWGANADPSAISGAAQTGATNLTHDFFGSQVLVSSDPIVGKCALKLFSNVTKAAPKAWKIFAKCKKVEFFSISNDQDLETVCLPDTNLTALLDLWQAKLQAYADKCALAGVSIADYGTGSCQSAPDTAAFASCLTSRIRCRLCQALNVADDIDAPGFDCDAFDNGAVDASCPN